MTQPKECCLDHIHQLEQYALELLAVPDETNLINAIDARGKADTERIKTIAELKDKLRRRDRDLVRARTAARNSVDLWEQAIDVIRAVERIHYPRGGEPGNYCVGCGYASPCPTKRELDRDKN